jgi:hypothetical protein
MAVIGSHVLLYTPEAEALRAVFRDVLGWSSVDAGDGWLIFDLPPGELGVHPSEPGDTHHELALTCDDISGTVAAGASGRRCCSRAGSTCCCTSRGTRSPTPRAERTPRRPRLTRLRACADTRPCGAVGSLVGS